MTPLPKRRLSTRRQAQREKGYKLKVKNLTRCPNCGNLYLPHHICSHCGYYNNAQIITTKTKTKKQE